MSQQTIEPARMMGLQDVVVTKSTEPPRYSSHGLDTHVMGDTAESLRSPSPAPPRQPTPALTIANNYNINNTSYSPNPLIDTQPVQSPPPLLRRTLTRLPTYRSAILPAYSRWGGGGGDKYAALRDLEAQGLSTERPRCLQYGWRIWLAVVIVIVVTVVTIAVAVTKAASKSG
jgi:hypothetical protein